MVVGILGRWVTDEIEDLHCDLLRHGLHAVVQFSLTLDWANQVLMFSSQNGGSFTATGHGGGLRRELPLGQQDLHASKIQKETPLHYKISLTYARLCKKLRVRG